MEGAPNEPWKKAMRWQVPQFPPGDSVEFSFQVVDPTTEGYEVALYNVDNVVLKRTQGEPTEKSAFLVMHQAVAFIVVGLLAAFIYQAGMFLFRSSAAIPPGSQAQTASPAKSADQTQIEQTVTESQKLKYMGVCRDPKGFDRSRLAAYWVSSAQGGEAIDAIIGSAQHLAKYDVKYGPESKLDRFEVVSVELLSPEFAEASTLETWYLAAYWNDVRIQGCTPNFHGATSYKLQKPDGRWLIQSESSTINGPDECAIRSRGDHAK
jgi:hypothetical protein